jgi:Bacterial Ig-like domain (group 2)
MLSGLVDTGDVTVTQPILTPLGVPGGIDGASYSQQFACTNGTAPYSFSMPVGDLSGIGVTLSAGGLLSGALSSTAHIGSPYAFDVRCTDSSLPTPLSVTNHYSLTVSPSIPSAGPPLYPAASRSTATVGTVSPVFSASTLANSVAYSVLNPTSIPITRITDQNTWGGASVGNVSHSGGDGDNMCSVNTKYCAFTYNGNNWIFHFDTSGPAIQIANSNLTPGFSVPGPFAFSRMDDQVFYWVTKNHVLHQGAITSDTTYTETSNSDFPFDFEACPGVQSSLGISPGTDPALSGGSILGIGFSDATISMSPSWVGGQGTGIMAHAYRPGSGTGKGCSSINLLTGDAWGFCKGSCGSASPVGTETSCTLPAGSGTHDSNLTYGGNVMELSDACQNQATVGNRDALWEVGTANILLSQHTPGGHTGHLTSHLINMNNPRPMIRTVDPLTSANITSPTNFFTFPSYSGHVENHGTVPSWDGSDTNMFLVGSGGSNGDGCVSGGSYLTPAYLCNEVFGLDYTALNAAPARFGPTYSTGTSANFACKNGIGFPSQDGRYFFIGTDMLNNLGNDSAGKPRCDVIAYSLGTSGAALSSITVASSASSIQAGNTATFTAQGFYSDGSQRDVTGQVTWASSNTGVAVVAASGNPRTITGVAAGTASISATIGSIVGSKSLTVTAAPPTLSSIALTPASASVVAGGTVNYTALGTYSDGSTGSVTNSCTWASSGTSVATVAGSGNPRVVTAVAAGATTISCTQSGVTGSAGLTVTAPSSGTVTISPATDTIPQGATLPEICWTNSNPNATCTYSLVSGGGSVSSNGNYTAPASNTTAVIRATNGSSHADATITVSGAMPTVGGDCASGYPHSDTDAKWNKCTMQHVETQGGTVTRNFWVVKPANYVSGQSPLIIHMGESSHGITNATAGGWCDYNYAKNEVGGWVPYVRSMPTPAPIIVCVEPYKVSAITTGPYIWAAWGNQIGSSNTTWDNGVIPDDPDFQRQVIFRVGKDLNTDPRKVYLSDDWNGGGTMIEHSAIKNADIVAAFASYSDQFGAGMDSSWTVRWGPLSGQSVPAPSTIGPVSGIILASSTSNVGSTTQWNMCGNNLTTFQQHAPTHDDILGYWTAADNLTSFDYKDNSGSNTKFCNGNYASGQGKPTTLEGAIGSGGYAGTELRIYRMMGSLRGTPYCSFDWSGNDTFCTSTIGAALDLRNTVCNSTTPCNHFVGVSSGYDQKGLQMKFLLAHPKP